jgi:hypothetical protein
VTNWVSSYGNHAFLNTTPVGVAELDPVPAVAALRAWPNPGRGAVRFSAGPADCSDVLAVFGLDGRLIRRLTPTARGEWSWDGRDASGKVVTPGIYFARLAGSTQGLKITRLGAR